MKKCTKCKKLLPLVVFNKNSSKEDGLQCICRFCDRKRSRQLYKKNPNYYKAHAHKHKEKRRRLIKELVLEAKKTGCLCCPEKEPACLDFHHPDPSKKEHSVGNMLWQGAHPALVLAEIKKCVVICSNCHRKVHAKIIKLRIRVSSNGKKLAR